jgi:hypothetical protein
MQPRCAVVDAQDMQFFACRALSSLLASSMPGSLSSSPPPATPLPAARVPLGEDAAWLAADGPDLFVAWGDDAPFELLPPSHARGSAGAAFTRDDEGDAHQDGAGAPWSHATTPVDAGGRHTAALFAGGLDAARVGVVDEATLLLVDGDGAASTLTRGTSTPEPAGELDPLLEGPALRELTLGECSETGRWPARGLDGVSWVAWGACASLVRCGATVLPAVRRRPSGVRVSLAIRASLESAAGQRRAEAPALGLTSPLDEGGSPDTSGQSEAGLASPVPGPGPSPNAAEIDRRVSGLVSVLLTLRFDPRAAARARLAASLTARRDAAPISVDVVTALGDDEARALVCGGAP